MVVASKGNCPACGGYHLLPDARSMDRKQMGCDDPDPFDDTPIGGAALRRRKQVVETPVDPGNGDKDYEPDFGSNPYTSDLDRRFFDNGQ